MSVIPGEIGRWCAAPDIPDQCDTCYDPVTMFPYPAEGYREVQGRHRMWRIGVCHRCWGKVGAYTAYREMKILCFQIKAGELQPGDVFSTLGEEYWEEALKGKGGAIGEKVYLRTEAPCPKGEEDIEVFRLRLSYKGDEKERTV